MPERFEIYVVYKRRYINTLPFLCSFYCCLLFFISFFLVIFCCCCVVILSCQLTYVYLCDGHQIMLCVINNVGCGGSLIITPMAHFSIQVRDTEHCMLAVW